MRRRKALACDLAVSAGQRRRADGQSSLTVFLRMQLQGWHAAQPALQQDRFAPQQYTSTHVQPSWHALVSWPQAPAHHQLRLWKSHRMARSAVSLF